MRTKKTKKKTMNASGVFYHKSEEPLTFSKVTFDILLKQDHPFELIGLYMFYYYTAKWQKTLQPKCTNSYAAKAAGWGADKLIKRKRVLLKLGMIENIQHRKTNGDFGETYIKVNYINGIPRTNDLTGSVKQTYKCLDIINKKEKIKITQKQKENFQLFWTVYPKKKGKEKAFESFIKRTKDLPPIKKLVKIVKLHADQDDWIKDDKQWVPMPATWLNQGRWQDEVKGIETVMKTKKKFSRYLDDNHHMGRKAS